jgi:biotin transport system substrate-specific component
MQILPLPSESIRTTEFLNRKVLRVALGTLFLAASSWVSIPVQPIPITMQTYAVIVIGALFGARLGLITVLAWLAEAAFGLPVLANGAAGAHLFIGPSAGYLFSFPVIAALTGWFSDRRLDRGIMSSFAVMLGANTINLALGVMWLAMFIGWHGAILGGFMPFWIGGLAKAFLATGTVFLLRGGLAKSTVYPQ